MGILKITKDPIIATIVKAKVVTGNFGPQLFCVVDDGSGEEHTLYLPWANTDGSMSGAAQQFIRTGLIGPEDFTATDGTFYDQLKGHTFSFERVFKDGKQFINIRFTAGAPAATPSPLKSAAVKELDLQEQQDTAAFKAQVAAPAKPATKPKESANDRIARAFAHVMETYAPQLAEMDQDFVRNICALTATHAIAYERE